MSHSDKGSARLGDSLLKQVSLPALVLHQQALNHNLRWMQNYANAHRAQLAPHGKTTMTPALFQRQLEQGAWGITLATAVQSSVAYEHGVRRVLMANQLVGEPNMAIIAGLLKQGGLEFHCLVENPDNVRVLGDYFGAQGLQLNVMLEIGVSHGRCGCRTDRQINAVLAAIDASPALVLTGIEGYEGVIHGERPEGAIQAFAAYLVETAMSLQGQGRFGIRHPYITASGSAWYDLIAGEFARLQADMLFTPLLRPGCYLVHDHGLYKVAQAGVLHRHPEMDGALLPAMEVWAHVQSLPEAGCAIIAFGKRDIAFDAGYPEPLCHYPSDERDPVVFGRDYRITAMMDQHAFLQIPAEHGLRVGDIIAFGASHPCLTFDKWRQVCLVDDDLNVVEIMPTFF
ncbi:MULTISPECIES: amino acid deaminase [Brenneria]|uniref:Amino acid deaminase n=1 Tax=Brenneria nigrifluens DSM 30175 = ATCC 13028 TaxID=1121120 RepID=A0A2U1UWP8_9GAMM|nr:MULTISPECIES: amino acid deaminase [Brenneria]EHD22548.1 alanine racemase domain protein [Brenneria sp. EniD312]PWC26077.1 amino acid deaminase [Brenneria nigrifluens] [Brenneria nigrifluens DSM 30175 = ATCC 13028]QCR05538.1 amino acid deaminase [Brenneria nigrifluens] [Brenneria nigrifluens DSM 30175 = ATCC 13028]